MRELIFDCEANSLKPDRFHVVSCSEADSDVIISATGHSNIEILLEKFSGLTIGHNIIGWDVPQLERVFNFTFETEHVDTLYLSWYLYPERVKHGLEQWGEYFGVPKPPVVDWEGEPIEVYVERCEEDVKINKLLWEKIKKDLLNLYDQDWKQCMRLIRYLMFKARCAAIQEKCRLQLDIPLAKKSLKELEVQRDEKIKLLQKAMPEVIKYEDKTRPKKPFKQNGSWSVVGAKWFNLVMREKNCTKHEAELFDGTISVEKAREEPNPGSHVQVKKWLFALGWEPAHYKYERDKVTNEVRKIPQIKSETEEGELCFSVLELCEQEPAIANLNGLGIIKHRISIFEGYLKHVDEEGFVYAGVNGLTNTLRFKHKAPLVNLPGVHKPWGAEIRGCLKAREGYELCGSDQSSLETNTKLHYMWEHDPEYVKVQTTPGFDPHLDLALVSGEVSEEQVEKHKAKELDLGGLRTQYKTVNYACTYGATATTIARQSKVSLARAQELVDVYWKRNWALKKIAENVRTKRANGKMWLFNPVSKFWYSLRYDKDRFSTLNQGTGVYVFDTWVKYVLDERPQLSGQFHDEIILEVKQGHRAQCEKLLRRALDKTNKRLKCNVQFDISVDFGQTYADVH